MFQKITFYDGQEPEGWQPFLKELSKDGAKGIMLFVGEETPFDYKRLQPLLKTMDIEVWGGIFPEVIYDGSLHKQGVVGCAFESPVSIEVIKDLGKFKGDLPDDFVLENTRTLLIFNDGWAVNTSLLIETLYEKSFKEMAFIGGRAGSLIDTRQKTPLLVAGMNAAQQDINTMPSLLSLRSLGRLAWSCERMALSRVKSQEHELKYPYVGTDCVELTPVDMETLMVEAGSPVTCGGEEVTKGSLSKMPVPS